MVEVSTYLVEFIIVTEDGNIYRDDIRVMSHELIEGKEIEELKTVLYELKTRLYKAIRNDVAGNDALNSAVEFSLEKITKVTASKSVEDYRNSTDWDSKVGGWTTTREVIHKEKYCGGV